MTENYAPTNYNGLKDYILNGRSEFERKIAHNTYARIEGDKIIVKYHNSDIVELTPTTTTLDSCGYKTPTTKERLNWYIPNGHYLYQESYTWYIRKGYWNDENGDIYIFVDGLTFRLLDSDNWFIDKNTCGNVSDVERIKDIKKKINVYVKNYVTELINGNVESPSGGDCWYCYMQTDKDGDNISIGQAMDNTDHIESHFDEEYYVPSLLYNAVKFYPMSIFANTVLYELWNDESRDYSWGIDIFKSQVKSSLKKFLLREFNIA